MGKMMNKPYEMTFAEFATAVKLSGSATRLPEMNRGVPVYSYSVFLNGDVAQDLAAGSRRFDFKDVMVTALTRQLGLDPKSRMDNLKVSELAAARSAWLESVSVQQHKNAGWGLEELSSDVLKDYEQLSKGMLHPFIQQELDKQRALTKGLQSVLEDASKKTGKVVDDLAPDEVSVGKVVSQSMDFTVQQTNAGEVVTHENRRLQTLPVLGDEVMVSYYRGSGQVVDSLEKMKISAPFIESDSEDLAVMLVDGKGKEQIILFNSMTGFHKFVQAHNLDPDLVRQAMDVREATPKGVAPLPVRELASEVYVEAESGCLAIDYLEDGVKYSALFGSAQVLESMAKEFGMGAKEIAAGKALDSGLIGAIAKAVKTSELRLRANLAQQPNLKINQVQYPVDGQSYVGKIAAESAFHVAQDVGRGVAVIHDLRAMDKVAVGGDSLTVKYEGGRGRVSGMARNDGLGR